MQILPTAVTFRAASPADVADVVALVESAYRGEPSRAGWTTEADLLDGQRTDAAEVIEVIEAPESELLLAEAPGSRLVACCQLERRPGPGAYFGMFAVRPGMQSGGIGRAVLAEAERRVRDGWGATWMEMQVITQRPEILAWYGRRGYRPTGVVVPFPYGNECFGRPLRPDLTFTVLGKALNEA